MAKILSQVGIETGDFVEAFHVTQSIDAFTGTEAYDITLSGSFTLITGTQGANKVAISDANGKIDFIDASTLFSGSISISGSFTGSFSGSFVGDGSGLTNISASSIVGLDLSKITSGSVTASVNVGTNAFTIVSGSTTLHNIRANGGFENGLNVTASGDWSHAEGVNSVASGSYSHAEGYYTISSGSYSHAEGAGTTASGQSSHAEGNGTTASGGAAHAEGESTTASGESAHAEGDSTIASGQSSHAEGSGTTASGYAAHAEGTSTIASGESAHAEGQATLASGSYSHAEGNGTTASGSYSHAEGESTTASGQSSHAEGESTQAIGDSSHAEGSSTIASGSYSHAEGNSTIASGSYSHAEGQSTTAYGNYSHAEGNSTISSGADSHAEGNSTQAIGEDSHAEGSNTKSTGFAAHSEGFSTIASGSYSHAEGYETIASGLSSHAEGFATVASGSYQHVQGQYNISSSAQSAFIVGNGTSNSSRSNLIFASGSTVQITGSLQVSGSITGSLLGTASNSLTASYVNPLNQDVDITGNITIHGTASVDVLITTYNSSSIIYSSGSTKFGDSLDDTHEFTGSVLVSGSLNINTTTDYPIYVSGSRSYLSLDTNATRLGTDFIAGELLLASTYDTGSSQFQFTNTAGNSIGVGVLGEHRLPNQAPFGNARDGFLFASATTPVLHIINAATGISGSEDRHNDSIKLWAGINPSNLTSSMLIMGTGSTKGNVSIGGVDPQNKLEVVGSVLATSFTGSLFGTASYATMALSASYAPSAVSALPQANKIYIDSINGVDSTGRGNINTPYLTPEYALADITNTGTVTATTTNASATLTAVSSTTNIVIGQFITGAGIPYNSVVVSKTVNTIVLSQVCTASATITATWWTIYEVILNGNFVVTSNLTKQGFYIVNNGHVIWGNFTLFNLNAIFGIPHKLLGKGDYFGNNSLSVFHDITAQQVAGFTYDLDHGIVDTIGTGYAIHHTSNLGVVNYIGDYVNAKFGYVLFVETAGFANISFNSYGLLGGIRANSSSCYVTVLGNITCPVSILALNLGSSLVSSTCDIVGSTTASRWVHSGNLQGTTHTIGGATINSGYCSGQIVSSGGHNILNLTDTTGLVTLSQTAISTVVNNGYITNVSQTAGTLINNGAINTGFLARGTCINNGVISCTDGLTIGVGTVFRNFGRIVTRIDTTGVGWRFENMGYLEVSNTNIDLSANGTFVNRGRIYNPVTADDVFTITSSGVVLENYGEIESGTANTTKAIISKSTGTVKLFAGSRLVVANASSPIKCTANTSASKDVYYFNVVTNCNGSTYGLLFAFDGGSFAPNDLVGGVLYENVNY